MQTAGFNSPLAIYLVLPEAELPGDRRSGGRRGNRKAPAGRWSAGNCSGRCGFRVRPAEGGQGRGVSEAPEADPCQPFRCCWRGKVRVHASESSPGTDILPLPPSRPPAIKGEEPRPGWARASPTDRLMAAAVAGEDRELGHLPEPEAHRRLQVFRFVSAPLGRPSTRALARAGDGRERQRALGRVTVQPEGPSRARFLPRRFLFFHS